MPPTKDIRVEITAPTSELGRALSRELAAIEPLRTSSAKRAPRVLINLLAQPPNTLLHDGNAWRRYPPERLVGDTRRMLADPAHRRAGYIVHASFAFLRAAQPAGRVGARLRPLFEAALEAEQLVIDDPRPAAVVRLGYLYGPLSRDLKRYRTAFRLGRPYWAGPKTKRHDHVHHADAALALLATAQRQPSGGLFYATDGAPLAFRTFMDHFARVVGNRLPLHLPAWSAPVSRAIIAPEHMEMVELGVRGLPEPMVPGYAPDFADFRDGLTDSIAGWR